VSGPSSGTDALVERVRREVSTPRPGHRARLVIDRYLGEALGCSGVVEHWSAHPVEHIDLAGQPVGKGEPEHAVADNGGFGYVRESGQSSEWLDRLKCLTRPGAAPVLAQLGPVQLGPGEHEPQLPPPRLLSITSRVSIRTFALPSACRAWKCGGPWSSKNIAI
jgi:hypothetical protein